MEPRAYEPLPIADIAYDVKIVRRDGDAQVNDDWHATITRRSDGKQATLTAAWRWLILCRTRRAALDRMWRRIDRRASKLAGVQEFER